MREAPESLFGAWFGAVPAGMRFTAIGWPVDASGLNDVLDRLRDHYGNPEVYVTENGACYDDHMAADGRVADDERVTYLREHIAAARRAIADGVKLNGYFAWSLLDNFEWSEGYSRRFGLIYVDFASQKRTPKASFNFLAETVKGGVSSTVSAAAAQRGNEACDVLKNSVLTIPDLRRSVARCTRPGNARFNAGRGRRR